MSGSSDDAFRRGSITFAILVAALVGWLLVGMASDDSPNGETWQLEQRTVEGRHVECVVVRNGNRQQITAIDCEQAVER